MLFYGIFFTYFSLVVAKNEFWFINLFNAFEKLCNRNSFENSSHGSFY